MIRFASIRAEKHNAPDRRDPSGLTPQERILAVCGRVTALYAEMAGAWDRLRGQASVLGLRLIESYAGLNDAQRAFCDSYFRDELYASIQPLMFDSGKRFPFLAGRTLNLGVTLKWRSGDIRFGAAQIPASLGRLVRLPSERGCVMIPIEEIVREHIGRLYPDHQVLSCAAFRLTRDADLELDEEEPGALADAVRRSLSRRGQGGVTRIEIEKGMDRRLARLLARQHNVSDRLVFSVETPLDLTFIEKEIYPLSEGDAHRYAVFEPVVPEALRGGESIFDVLRQGELLLHHPFDSFEPVVRFLREAAEDEQVTAIRITLYRLSNDSPIIDALAHAARTGKQVTAFIEARARFDEEHNLACGEVLERAGVNVVYGLPGLKTHSKIALVVRREADGLHKYTQLGTGNYNDVTARAYTDYSLLTADMAVGADGLEFFRCLSGCLEHPDTEKLVVAPFELRERFIEEIKRERKKGADGYIMARMNSLTDRGMIKALYKASRAGVRIRLLVRGSCCLIPGVPDMSESIEVRSVVGRFLEHSRAYVFGRGGERRVYLSSADWMTRNLDYRVELMFPITARDEAEQVVSELTTCLTDAPGTYRLLPDGGYEDTGARGGVSVQRKLLSAKKKKT